MYTLPDLPYKFDALEPFIDVQTMETHHDRHHATYVTNLNNALANLPEYSDMPINELLAKISELPDTVKQAVINNGGGHANHTLFWESMSKDAQKAPSGDLLQEIAKKYVSLEKFKEIFANAGLTRFGSGWSWFVLKDGKELNVYSTPNQDSPVMTGDVPLLGLDVWEHAYYLKYQNKRADYIQAWWNVVDWSVVEERYSTSLM